MILLYSSLCLHQLILCITELQIHHLIEALLCDLTARHPPNLAWTSHCVGSRTRALGAKATHGRRTIENAILPDLDEASVVSSQEN